MSVLKLVNLKGNLFATAASFAAQTVIRLISSLILTRILQPAAYGAITILLSILFVLEMLSDIGVNLFIIRDKNAEQARYRNTAWTIRLLRHCLNSMILFFCAPIIASTVYHAPSLTAPLRMCSLVFVLFGLESMSLPLAIRRKNSRVIMYAETVGTLASAAFAVLYCYYSRDYWGMVYGTLLNRLVITGFSHFIYPDVRPRFAFDSQVAREMMRFTRFTLPSSWLTLALSQFDKIVFLWLFNLQLLGVYGVAANIAGSVETLTTKISQMVLYPRCAHNFREDRQSFALKYYTENTKLFASVLFLPALIGGSAQLLIRVLYDSRYALAGTVLQALMVRAILLSFAAPAEDLLVAAGEYQVILHGNVLRAGSMAVASLVGYELFGFLGFIYGISLSGLLPLAYYLWVQKKRGMLIRKYEMYKVAFAATVMLLAYSSSALLSTAWSFVRR